MMTLFPVRNKNTNINTDSAFNNQIHLILQNNSFNVSNSEFSKTFSDRDKTNRTFYR